MAKSLFSSSGFDDWRNGTKRIKEHEEGMEHKNCLLAYTKRKSATGCIDEQLILQPSRGLAFRGENQKLGSTHNGNYLGLLELISEYDPFLKNHFQIYGNKGKGQTSYLSANICEEIIQLIAKQVAYFIVEELKKSKYYSICVDSTPDISHQDQLTFTVRYLINDQPIERFLAFIPIEAHGSEYLSNVVTKFLKYTNISIEDCRGQSCDNASNMSGQYSGLQARLKEINKYAEYVPCAGHSLTLVGVKAVECGKNWHLP
ncbi:52 kDa repressor of the inhibitor of the protein kinase-like [Copidosoma floridanum]|uniref:52 kDa repressor of the inhibitor of the protein kinase-like n=1 Tax=Copidosoma floridanum TaxID=29053 RepID=UPI000C6FBECF|nr:52 kDa repressor of the inhibitor of the protein kinase-like [Copidosoma floridanum]